MRRVISVAFLAAILLGGRAFSSQNSSSQSASGLRSQAATRDFNIGAAVSARALRDEPQYRETLAREFNMVVAENAFKFESLHPSQSRYSFADADALMEFAQRHNMKVRGHTLIWHSQLPTWVTEGSWTRDQAIGIMRDHIQTVVGRYKGRIVAWDVVNEAIDDKEKDGLRQDSFWYRTIGPDYIKMAFRMTREVDPDAILYYNDFSNEDRGRRSDLVYRLVGDLKRQGVPIDGVGWQMHLGAGFRIKAEHRENAQRLADIGVEVSITELDIRMKLPASADIEKKQADSYRDIASFCVTQPNCRALVLWGFTDKHSWIPETFAGEGNALLFDASYRAKPSYDRVAEVLQEADRNAPVINSAMISDGALVLEGSNFEKGSVLFINGRLAKPSSLRAPSSLTVKNIEKLLPERKVYRLQVQGRNGKLSIERRFTKEDGLL